MLPFQHLVINRCFAAVCDICLCLSFRVRHKQNKYPILFLTQGISDKYPEMMDIRCQSTKIAMSFAQSENILVRYNRVLYYNDWSSGFQCNVLFISATEYVVYSQSS